MTGPSRVARGRTLHPGTGTGRVLRLTRPLSFWGGVDPAGRIVDRHHPQQGLAVAGTVLVMSAGRGSSSSSSVLAELVRSGTAPAAVVLSRPDAIVVLGVLAAAELYGTRVPVLHCDPAALDDLPDGVTVTVDARSAEATVTCRD